MVVIGASAGGVAPLRALVSRLPADLEAVVLVALHSSPRYRSMLVEILRPTGPLPVEAARDGQELEPGRIIVAPSHHQMLITPDRRIALGPLPPHDGRWSFDALLRSAAEACGPEVVGVVLSGSLDCGAAGLLEVKARGGLAMAQDPREATVASMPTTAIERVAIDVVAPAAELGAWIGRVCKKRTPSSRP